MTDVRTQIQAAGGLVSLNEAGLRCGISRQRMSEFAQMEGFPMEVPISAGARIKLYLGCEVEKWLRDYRSGLSPHRAARAVNARSLDDFERGF